MHGCCMRTYGKRSPASSTTNTEWLGTTLELFIWLPPLLQHGFCQVRGNHLLPGDNGWPGRRGLEIGRANKIERKWQALSQNLQYLPACLQQVCHLNKHPSWYLLASVCVRACISTCCVYIHTCVSAVSACVYVYFLSNLDHFEVRIVPESSWYAVNVMALTKNLFPSSLFYLVH